MNLSREETFHSGFTYEADKPVHIITGLTCYWYLKLRRWYQAENWLQDVYDESPAQVWLMWGIAHHHTSHFNPAVENKIRKTSGRTNHFLIQTFFTASKHSPSKHARSDLHPVRIGSEALAGSGPDDCRTPASFRTGSVWPKNWHNQPELSRIRAGLAQYYPGRLWKNGTESESGKLVAGRLRPARKRGQVMPAHRLASRPDTFGQTMTRPSRSDPGWFCTVWPLPSLKKKNGTETDAGSRIRHIYYPGRFWLHSGRNGHNWP